MLESCVAVLEAINEDSSAVPTLLTDYILKGLSHLLASRLVRMENLPEMISLGLRCFLGV